MSTFDCDGRRPAALGQTEMSFGVQSDAVDEDDELKQALALSRQDIDVEDEEADLRRAIQLSMQGGGFPILSRDFVSF